MNPISASLSNVVLQPRRPGLRTTFEGGRAKPVLIAVLLLLAGGVGWWAWSSRGGSGSPTPAEIPLRLLDRRVRLADA